MATYKEAHHRSLIKAISWRVVATTTTIAIVFIFTGQLVLSFGVGAVEVVSKLLLYYLHERAWHKLGFGREEHPLSSLPVRKALATEDMETIRNKLRELGYIGD